MPSQRGLRRAWSRWALAAVLGLVIPLVGSPARLEAEKPNQPPYFAITDARIVTGAGQTIEKGTIVLSKGLIAEVGMNATIPAEAWVIDGSGLTVYPGLVDALSDLGLREERSGPPGAGGPQASMRPSGNETVHGPEDRPQTTPWKCAADELKTGDKRLESWRNGGFTSAVSAPDDGIFPGQAAFINLAAERPRNMVVETPAAFKLSLESSGGGRNFPGSLFGIMAYIKQVFADADHYQAAWSAYDADPRGRQRPKYDRALEPVVEARAEKWPVLIPGQWGKEIKRAIKLGEDLGVTTVVYGAHQGYAAADALREKKVPVLVSVKWPEASKDADPEADVPLRTLRLWDQAPTTPAVLEKAGVRYAFYSDGLKSPKEIMGNVRKAIEAGLSKEAALRAMTLSAAEIYGVGDRLGSLEPGKIANVVVTDGELFDEETKVKMVFIDGVKFNVRETEETERPKPGMRWN
jgi:imidazolonepropionase-like amidohydrolase